MSNICICDESVLFPRCNNNPQYCEKIQENVVQEDPIWATQISFE
jgi:hypothetical protein